MRPGRTGSEDESVIDVEAEGRVSPAFGEQEQWSSVEGRQDRGKGGSLRCAGRLGL